MPASTPGMRGYTRPDAAVAGRLQALAATGMIRLREVAVRLADPAAGWLPLAALDRGQITDPSQVTSAHEVRRHSDHELAALFGDIDVLVTPTTPQTAFPLEDYEANLPAGHLCWAFNLSGHPVGYRPGRPARRPPDRVAGRCRAASGRPGRGAGRAGRGQPAGSAGPLASSPRLTSSARCRAWMQYWRRARFRIVRSPWCGVLTRSAMQAVQSRRVWLAQLTAVWMWTPSRLAIIPQWAGKPHWELCLSSLLR